MHPRFSVRLANKSQIPILFTLCLLISGKTPLIFQTTVLQASQMLTSSSSFSGQIFATIFITQSLIKPNSVKGFQCIATS